MTTLERLQAIFRAEFRDPTLVITEATNASHIKGWDSFAQTGLIVTIEDAFGVLFTTEEMGSLTNVGDVLAILRSKGVD